MKKLILSCICIIFIFPFTSDAGNFSFDERIQKAMKNLGVDLSKVNFKEIEPNSFINYDDYVSNYNKIDKKTRVWYWDSACDLNLDERSIRVRSSSTLNGYPTSNLFDKKASTAWVEGEKENGIGEWVSIKLTLIVDNRDCEVYFRNFGIISGYLKSVKAWDENNRVKSLLLIYKGYRGSLIGYDYSIFRLKLKDFKGIQFFNISSLNAVAAESNMFWLMIEDINKGTKYDDTCISELVFSGDVPADFLDP